MKIIGLLFFLYFSFATIAQNPDIKRTWHWYFGDGAGIDFSNGTAVADTSGALHTSEGCATISDTAGNLLFYSDGRTVWNRNHQVMPNGTGLMGGANGSSTQAALIIPKPLSSNLYYLFTTDEAENLGANGMRYSVIDMNLVGGLGDLTVDKNILLFAPCTEKLAAVNHCNDTSVWIMGHETNNDHFVAYLITPSSIDTNSIVSAIGLPMMDNALQSTAGNAKFSPNGKLFCSGTDTFQKRIELFQFNNATGILSNRVTLMTNYQGGFGKCFSPNNMKLYLGNTLGSVFLYQYDVSTYDSSLIGNSQTIIGNVTSQGGYSVLQNGSDGKIYIDHSTSDQNLSVIEDPNAAGLACNLNLFMFTLLGRNSQIGLPNFNESYFNQSPSIDCFTGISNIENEAVKIFPNPFTTSATITINQQGNFDFMLYNLFGQQVRRAENISDQYILERGDLPAGVYFYKVEEDGKVIGSGKVVVE